MKFVPGLVLMAAAAVPGAPEPAPGLSTAGVNFNLPVFTAKGYRQYFLSGSRATQTAASRYEVTNMRLVHYKGDAANTIETIVLSPRASFAKEKQFANGTEGVRVIRDDLEVSGNRWSYDHLGESLIVEDRVEVTIHAVLPAILK
jgi:hypothetical protein